MGKREILLVKWCWLFAVLVGMISFALDKQEVTGRDLGWLSPTVLLETKLLMLIAKIPLGAWGRRSSLPQSSAYGPHSFAAIDSRFCGGWAPVRGFLVGPDPCDCLGSVCSHGSTDCVPRAPSWVFSWSAGFRWLLRSG